MTYGNNLNRPEEKFIKPLTKKEGMLPDLLYNLLTRATPHGLEEHIRALLPFREHAVEDEKGNLIMRIGENNSTIFSCHMDTVHHVSDEGIKKGTDYRIKLITSSNDRVPATLGHIWGALHNKFKEKDDEPTWMGTQLGADDKVGVYTLCKLIEKKVPGIYIFHVGEERGCIGSRWLVQNNPQIAQGIKRCIAFDRAGYTDVIAHQIGKRCASKVCTDAIARELNGRIQAKSYDFTFRGDVHGVCTDSAYYRELIPECINLSVGYFDQHTPQERFDWDWYSNYFLPAVLDIDWNILPTIRDPLEIENKDYGTSYSYINVRTTWNSRGATIGKTTLKPQYICRATPEDNIPDWLPKDGLVLEASIEGMNEILRKWARKASHITIASVVHELLMRAAFIQHDFDILAGTGEILNDNISDVGVPEQKPGELPILPAPFQTGTSVIALADHRIVGADALGYPKDGVIFAERAQMKLDILKKIVSEKHCLRLRGKPGDEFNHLVMKFGKLNKNLGRGKATYGKKMYLMLNELLSSAVKIIGEEDKMDSFSTALAGAYSDGRQHLRNYWFEPGVANEISKI